MLPDFRAQAEGIQVPRKETHPDGRIVDELPGTVSKENAFRGGSEEKGTGGDRGSGGEGIRMDLGAGKIVLEKGWTPRRREDRLRIGGGDLVVELGSGKDGVRDGESAGGIGSIQ